MAHVRMMALVLLMTFATTTATSADAGLTEPFGVICRGAATP